MKEIYDVVVAGGGPAGVAAAIAAARRGASTVLIESYGFLGGMGTAGLVAPFMNYYAGEQRLVNGIFKEMTDQLTDMEAFGGSGDPLSFDAEALKLVLDQMCMKAGVDVLFHTFVSGITRDGARLTQIACVNKSGNQLINGKIFIDATGDGDVAAYAGCQLTVGRETDGCCQPATLMFKMGGVHKTVCGGVEYEVPKEHGLPQGRVLYFGLPRKGEVAVNMTRMTGINPIDIKDISKAEMEGRHQAWEIAAYLKKHVEGFEHAYLMTTAVQVGIRESRHIIGDYLLDDQHVLDYKKSEDDIAWCSYKIDIHNPLGDGTEIQDLEENQYYGIPYRCLTPVGADNLLIAGRAISASHKAHSSLRIMPTCYGIGEAAGVAAYLALSSGNVRSVDIRQLQAEINAV